MNSMHLWNSSDFRVIDLTQNFKTQSVFPLNHVYTSKYTKFSFVPKNIFEQFQRTANFWFLMICVLQALP